MLIIIFIIKGHFIKNILIFSHKTYFGFDATNLYFIDNNKHKALVVFMTIIING